MEKIEAFVFDMDGILLDTETIKETHIVNSKSSIFNSLLFLVKRRIHSYLKHVPHFRII